MIVTELSNKLFITDELSGYTTRVNSDGELYTTTKGSISTGNTTSINLFAGETFTGEWEEITDSAIIKVNITADVGSAIDGLDFQQSPDQTIIFDEPYDLSAGAKKLFTPNPIAKYFRIVYTNGIIDQSSFSLQTIYSSVYTKPSSHKINSNIVGQDDAELVSAILKVQTNDEDTYKNIDVQNPLPVDGDSVYGKDLHLPECDNGDFIITSDPTANQTEIITSMVSDVWIEKKNDTTTNPKIVTLAFRRPILTTSFGIDSGPNGTFSNTKVYVKQGQEEFLIVDESSDNTKHKIKLFSSAPLKFSEIRFEFHTSDTITTGLYGIFKHTEVASRLQALKPDGTVTDIDATNGGNLKISIEELETGISVNNNSQLRTTQFNSNGIEQDIDLNGLTLSREFLTEVKLGNIPGYSLIHKFGRNDVIGTTPTAIAVGGVYATPTTNTILEILSSSSSDSVGGGGATKIVVQGLVEAGGVWSAQEEELTLTGTTPVIFSNNFIRVFRAWISESESYASLSSVSGVGTITIRVSGGGVIWLQIGLLSANNSTGQSQTAFYTTPTNSKGILFSPQFTVDSTKVASLAMFLRPNADDVVSPYSGARRLIHQWDGVASPAGSNFLVPFSKFEGATDFGFLASVSVGTGTISAEFWVLEIAT